MSADSLIKSNLNGHEDVINLLVAAERSKLLIL